MSLDSLNALVHLPSPLETLSNHSLLKNNIAVDVKRDDLIHPTLSGNKYRKLKGHIKKYSSTDYEGIITMGGAWSNHLHATGWVCNQLGISLQVIVRGPEPKHLSDTLSDIQAWGSEIEFVSRAEYRQLRECYETQSKDVPPCLAKRPNHYFIPEGGRHKQSLEGMAELASELEHTYDAVYMAVGTATTLASLIAHWHNPATIFNGILAIDAEASQLQTLNLIAPDNSNPLLLRKDYLFGGYAKCSAELSEFIIATQQTYGLILEPVYTAKAFYALTEDVNSGRIKPNSRILFIHSGGLQGLRGFSQYEFAAQLGIHSVLENLPFKDH